MTAVLSTATGWPSGARRESRSRSCESPLTTVTKSHAREVARGSARPGPPAARSPSPRVTMNVSTSGRARVDRRSRCRCRAPRRPAPCPAFVLQGSFWQTFASPSRSPAALGAANAGSRWPTSRAPEPLALVRQRLGEQQHAEGHQQQDPHEPRCTCCPARGTSGRRAGSGCVRSRSASRSPHRRGPRSGPRPRSRPLTARPGWCAARPRSARPSQVAHAERAVLLGPHERRRQHDHHAEQGDRQVHHGHDAEVAQHADVGGDQRGEAGDRRGARSEHRRAGGRVGQLDRARRARRRRRAPGGSAPRAAR